MGQGALAKNNPAECSTTKGKCGEDKRFSTDESVSYEALQRDATAHKATVKYGALMCIVNGQI